MIASVNVFSAHVYVVYVFSIKRVEKNGNRLHQQKIYKVFICIYTPIKQTVFCMPRLNYYLHTKD